MRGTDAHRRLLGGPLRVRWLRVALMAGSAIALGWLGPGRGAGRDVLPLASAQAQHVPRALDITALGTVGGPMTAVAVDGTRVYAIRGGWLEAYDGRDPAALVLEGQVALPGSDRCSRAVYRIAAGDGRVAVALTDPDADCPTSRWLVFEARPGQAPAFAGSLRVDDYVSEGAVVVAGGYLYTRGMRGLCIVDVRDAARPVVVHTFDEAMRFALRDGSLFFARDRPDAEDGTSEVMSYDVRNPAHPVLVAHQAVSGRVRELVLHRGHLLAWMFESRVIPSDLTVQILTADPPTLALVGKIPIDLYADLIYDVILVGDYAAVMYPGIREGMHILTFDLRSLPATLPQAKGYGATTGYGVSLAALDGSLVAADAEWGLLTLSVDPTSGAIAWRGAVDALGAPHGLATDGRYAYTLDDDAEIWVLEVLPSGAVEAVAHTRLTLPDGRWPSTSFGASIALVGDRLWVARGEDWFNPGGDLYVVDVADPLRPRTLALWKPTDDPLLDPNVGASVSVYGPLAVGSRLLVAGLPGLIDLNLDNPTEPRVQRVYDPDCHAGDGPAAYVEGCVGRGVAVDGAHAFVARGVAGVQEFDLAEGGPSDPVAAFATGGDPYDVAVTDQAVLVANGRAGFHVADRHSSRTADLSGIFAAYRISLVGDTAYVVGQAMPADPWSQWASVWAIDVDDPFTPILRGHAELTALGDPGFDDGAPPHALRVGDLLLATVPNRGIAVFRLADGRPLPAARLLLPSLIVAR